MRKTTRNLGILGVLAEIRTRYLPNTNPMLCRSNQRTQVVPAAAVNVLRSSIHTDVCSQRTPFGTLYASRTGLAFTVSPICGNTVWLLQDDSKLLYYSPLEPFPEFHRVWFVCFSLVPAACGECTDCDVTSCGTRYVQKCFYL
jgi:hypothetical protein